MAASSSLTATGWFSRYLRAPGASLENASTHFTGKSMDIALSKEMLGRVFDGAGRPIDALGEIYPEERRNINGSAINPVSRKYPRSCIYTGISAIDGCATSSGARSCPSSPAPA